MKTTDEQYREYLERRLKAVQAANDIMTAKPAPIGLLFRVRSNGSGSFIWSNKKWRRTE